MYAFNKRFRPTLYGGALVMPTLVSVLATLLLWLFAVGAITQLNAIPTSMLLLAASFITIFFAISTHRNKDRRRLLASIAIGEKEAHYCSQELGRGKGLSE